MFDLCGRVARRIASYYISFERAGTDYVVRRKYPPDASDVYAARILEFGFTCCTERRVGEDFVIVFTDERGTLEFVFCHWPNDQVILCLASGLPWFGCFHGLLDIIWRNDLHRDSRWHVLHPFLSRLMTTEPPPPSVDHVTCSDPFSISRHIKFRIPTSNSPHNLKYVMEYYNALDTSLWIHIFVCLLLERSVLFHSRRLSRLTSCVLASVSLLYPIQWVNSFYPLIPKRVIEVLGCPVPFVAGIHACNLEAAMEHVNPGTCLVDLDTGVIRMFEEKFVTPKAVYHFLRHEMKDVQRQLKAALHSKKTKNVDWKKVDGEACNFFEQLTKPFFRLIVNLLGCYGECITYNPPYPEVDFDSLISYQNCPSLEPFLRALLDSQAVRLFLESRARTSPDPSTDAFEAMCRSLYSNGGKHTNRKQRFAGDTSFPSTPVPLAVALKTPSPDSMHESSSRTLKSRLYRSPPVNYGTEQWIRSKKIKNPGELCTWTSEQNMTHTPKNVPSSSNHWTTISQVFWSHTNTLKNLSRSKDALSLEPDLGRASGLSVDDVTTRSDSWRSKSYRTQPLSCVSRSQTTSYPVVQSDHGTTARIAPASVFENTSKHPPTPAPPNRPLTAPSAGRSSISIGQNHHQSKSSVPLSPKPRPPRPPPPRTPSSCIPVHSLSSNMQFALPTDYTYIPLSTSFISASKLGPANGPRQPVENITRPGSASLVQHKYQQLDFQQRLNPKSASPVVSSKPWCIPTAAKTDTTPRKLSVPGLLVRRRRCSRIPSGTPVVPPVPPRRPSSQLFTPSSVAPIRLVPTSQLLLRRLNTHSERSQKSALVNRSSQLVCSSYQDSENSPHTTVSATTRLIRPRSETVNLPVPSQLAKTSYRTKICIPRVIDELALETRNMTGWTSMSSSQQRSVSMYNVANGDCSVFGSRESGSFETKSSTVCLNQKLELRKGYSTFTQKRHFSDTVPTYRWHRAQTVCGQPSTDRFIHNATGHLAPLALPESQSQYIDELLKSTA